MSSAIYQLSPFLLSCRSAIPISNIETLTRYLLPIDCSIYSANQKGRLNLQTAFLSTTQIRLFEFISVLQAQDVRFIFEAGRGCTAAVHVVAAGFAGAVNRVINVDMAVRRIDNMVFYPVDIWHRQRTRYGCRQAGCSCGLRRF